MHLAKSGKTGLQQLAPACIAALATLLLGPMTARAIEPTELEPAAGLDAKQFQLELTADYLKFDEGSETELEAELSYAFNEKLRLGLSIPYEFAEEEGDHLGDIGVFLEWVANPDSDKIIVGGELTLNAPTGQDSNGIGGEAQLRFSHYFAEKHGLHLTLKGNYKSEDEDDQHWFDDDDEGDREFGYAAVLGYTLNVTDATTLIADIVLGKEAEEDINKNLFELGLKHAFGSSVEIGLGVGAGLDDDSPDFVAHAGVEFKFGGGK